MRLKEIEERLAAIKNELTTRAAELKEEEITALENEVTAASLQMQRAYSVLLSTREKRGQRYITATRTAVGSVAQMR